MLGDHRRELAQDPAPGRAPARVRDAAARVAALEPEREVAVAVGVEAHAERLEVAEALGRLGAEDARGAAPHDPAARVDRVLLVLLGRVVGRERRGQPALRPVGRRLGERAGGDERDARALAGGGQGRVEAGGAGAHDDEVGPLHGKPYGIRVPRTVWLRHELSLAHDVPGHPERPERIVALEAAMERHDWFGCELVEAPEASQESLLAVHPARHIRYIDELSASGGGHVDMDTIAVEATYAAALRAAGGGVALVDALLSGEAATGFSALRPPGHHAEPDRAMGFCFFGNAGWRRATRRRRTASSAC